MVVLSHGPNDGESVAGERGRHVEVRTVEEQELPFDVHRDSWYLLAGPVKSSQVSCLILGDGVGHATVRI